MKIIIRIYGVAVGIISGLFIGLFIIGTIIRIMLDIFFGYGDSGPQWVTGLIVKNRRD